MFCGDVGGGAEVSDCTGDFADFVVGAGAEAELGHCLFEEHFTGLVEFAVFSYLAMAHSRVSHSGCAGVAVAEAGGLDFACSGYALADGGGVELAGFVAELLEAYGGDVDVDIDAVDEWAGDFGDVFFDLSRRAAAAFLFGSEVAAGAGVHGGDEHELCGEADGAFCAGDGDESVFEGLAYHFEDMAGEFGEFIEEEDAEVREGEFSGAWVCAAANEGGAGCTMVGHSYGAGRKKRVVLSQKADGRVDSRGFERFGQGKRGQDGRKSLGEHCFACAGRAYHHYIVGTRGGDG